MHCDDGCQVSCALYDFCPSICTMCMQCSRQLGSRLTKGAERVQKLPVSQHLFRSSIGLSAMAGEP